MLQNKVITSLQKRSLRLLKWSQPLVLATSVFIGLQSLTMPVTAGPTDLKTLIQEPMPDWYGEGFSRGHLQIETVMKQGFSRFQAIEIQNHMKDILLSQPLYHEYELANQADDLFRQGDSLVLQALASAIKRVKAGEYESGFQPRRLNKGDFYVAFDMDETLLTQWYSRGAQGAAWSDLKNLSRDYILHPLLIGPDYVSMTPGWQSAMLDIARTPGCQGILIFTAKEDRAAHAIIDQLKIEGQPLRGFLKGVFTRNHLVRDRASVKLSKDLRVIDESLEHIILIDDNPTRVFPKQQANLREFPKYNPDRYLEAKASGEKETVKLIESYMPTVSAEIIESADYAQKNQLSFREAFYPHSMAASAELLMLLKQGENLSEAQQFLRKDAELFEPKFFIPEQKNLQFPELSL